MLSFSKRVIVICFLLVILFVIGWQCFQFKEYSKNNYKNIRDYLVPKYSDIIVAENQDLYEILNAMDKEVQSYMHVTKVNLNRDYLQAFHLVLGISTDIHAFNSLGTLIFIFSNNMVFNCFCFIITYFLTRQLQSLFDVIPKERKHKLPKKNVFLSYYKKQLEEPEPKMNIVDENGKSILFRRVLPHFSSELIQPVQLTYPSLLPLFFYMIMIFVVSCGHCWINSKEFLTGLTEVSEYVNGIDYAPGMGFWLITIACITKIIYITALWNTAEFFVQFISWICCFNNTPKPMLVE